MFIVVSFLDPSDFILHQTLLCSFVRKVLYHRQLELYCFNCFLCDRIQVLVLVAFDFLILFQYVLHWCQLLEVSLSMVKDLFGRYFAILQFFFSVVLGIMHLQIC